MKNKTLAALGLAAGIVVAGAAAPAFAHHTTLDYTVTCEADWTYTVSMSVLNSESDKVMTIDTVTGNSLVTAGDTVDKAQTRVYSQTAVTAPYTEQTTIGVSWPNGVKAGDTADLTLADFPACVKPTPTPTPDPTPTVTPDPTPTTTPPVVTPPTSTPEVPQLALSGPNPLAIFLFFILGISLIAFGIVMRLWLAPRKPKHSTKE